MHRLFYPRSIVVIGVSAGEGNIGKITVKNFVDNEFQGTFYAVGARAGEVYGQHIYGSLTEIPRAIDLAVILTPAAIVPDILRQCGERDITRAVIISAGFSEFGTERADAERAIGRTADEYGIRFVGPNCVGIINTANNMFATFYPTAKGSILPGRVSCLAQSGTMATAASIYLTQQGIGIGKAVSLGNKQNLDEVDFLEYLLRDEATDVITMYLESLSRGRALYEVAKTSTKPIAIHKAGVGSLGSRAARSHTAAMANDDRIVDAALRQAGVIRVRRTADLFAAAEALTLPPMTGDNVGVAGSSGGVSVTASDACDYAGLNVPPYPKDVLDDIERLSPQKVIRRGNPLDFGDMFDNNVFLHSLELIAALPDIHGMVVCPRNSDEMDTTGANLAQVLQSIRDLALRSRKPITMTFGIEPPILRTVQRDLALPVFTYAEDCIDALAVLRTHSRLQSIKGHPVETPKVDRDRVAGLFERARAQGKSYLGAEAIEVLEAYGITAARSVVVAGEAQAIAAASELGYPLVAKVQSPDIVHKSDVGGVVVGISSAAELRDAYQVIMRNAGSNQPEARIEGVLLQQMVVGGREMIVGAKRDEQFGPVAMVGLGGTYVEVLEDVALRLAPLSRAQAIAMLEELRGAKLLKGVRGEAPADEASLVDALVRVGQLMVDFPEITELDINPLKVQDIGKGSVAVDARIVLT